MAYLGALDEARALDECYGDLLDSFDYFEGALSNVDYVSKSRNITITDAKRLSHKVQDLGEQLLDLSSEVHDIVSNMERAAYLATTQFANQRSTKPTPTNIAKVQKLLNLNRPELAETVINYYNDYYA